MKKRILAAINNEVEQQIENLIEHYEQQISNLTEQNHNLQNTIIKQNENIINLEKLLVSIKDEIIEPTTPMEWLHTFQSAVVSGNEELIEPLIKNFNKQKIKILNLNKDDTIHFTKELLKTFQSPLKERIDPFVIKLLISLADTKYQNLIGNTIKKEIHLISENIILMPSIFLDTLKMLSMYRLIDLTIDDLITKHIEKIIPYCTKNQLAHLFWYAFMTDSEKIFLSVVKDNIELIYENEITTEYFKLKETSLTHNDLKKLKQLLLKSNFFTNKEFEKIYGKLDRMYHMQFTSAPYIVKENLCLIKDRTKNQFISKFSLHLSEITIALYDKNSKKITGEYITIPALIDVQQKTAFITVSEHAVLQNNIKPSKIGITPKYLNYKWPSTVLSQKIDVINEFPQLQEESPLKKMGYNNPALSDEQRWAILYRAVKEIGLSKVAYTIASNTKRLKGRKPDSPYITKWEIDLLRLKKTFYKNEFSWPKS
ncbi:MAG: hypothetical protein ABS934_12260 [Psychrobacillus sp.]